MTAFAAVWEMQCRKGMKMGGADAVEIEWGWHALEAEPLGSACRLVVRVGGVAKEKMQAFIEQLRLALHSHKWGPSV